MQALPVLGVYLRGMKTRVHKSTCIRNVPISLKLRTFLMLTNVRVSKLNIIHLYNNVQLINKKKWTAIYNKMWMGRQIIMLNKTNSAKTQHDLPLIPVRWSSRAGHTELCWKSQNSGCLWGGNGTLTGKEHERPFWDDKHVLCLRGLRYIVVCICKKS